MANDKRNTTGKTIRLDDIFFIVLKHYKSMVGLALIGFVAGILVGFAFYLKGLTTVEYYVTASIAVTSTNENGLFSANSDNPNATDIHLAEDMTDAVIYVCKSDTTLNAAAERLQLIGVSASQIRPNLMLSQYQKTQIIEMTLVWDNAEEGMLILNAITEVVPDILIQTLKLGDVSIVNPPKVNTSSLSFVNVKIVAICTLLGIFAACGYHLLLFFIHPTYLHSEDVVDAYDLEILGEIPKDNQYFSTKINSVAANDFYSVQEYFSALAHALTHKLKDVEHPSIYITSSAAEEGKTTITANLAYVLSKLGYKVLLMDMDVRNPSLGSKFIIDRSESRSLNAVIRGDVEFKDALISLNSNFDILPTRLEDEFVRLDNRVVDLIKDAKQYYDFVILDTAPVGQVADSMNLNEAADCCMFVIRQDQVWVSTVTDSINRLRKSGISILGVIMNDTRGGSGEYYNYSYKQYGNSPYIHMPPKRSKGEGKKGVTGIFKSRKSKRDSESYGSDGEDSKLTLKISQAGTYGSFRDSSLVSKEEMKILEETPVEEFVGSKKPSEDKAGGEAQDIKKDPEDKEPESKTESTEE